MRQRESNRRLAFAVLQQPNTVRSQAISACYVTYINPRATQLPLSQEVPFHFTKQELKDA